MFMYWHRYTLDYLFVNVNYTVVPSHSQRLSLVRCDPRTFEEHEFTNSSYYYIAIFVQSLKSYKQFISKFSPDSLETPGNIEYSSSSYIRELFVQDYVDKLCKRMRFVCLMSTSLWDEILR